MSSRFSYGNNYSGDLAVEESLETLNTYCPPDTLYLPISEYTPRSLGSWCFTLNDLHLYPDSIQRAIVEQFEIVTDPAQLDFDRHIFEKHGYEAIQAIRLIAETIVIDPDEIVTIISQDRDGFTRLRLTTRNPVDEKKLDVPLVWLQALEDKYMQKDLDVPLLEARLRAFSNTDYLIYCVIMGLDANKVVPRNSSSNKQESKSNHHGPGYWGKNYKRVRYAYEQIRKLVHYINLDFPEPSISTYKEALEILAPLNLPRKNFRTVEGTMYWYPVVILGNVAQDWLNGDPNIVGAKRLARYIDEVSPLFSPKPRTAYMNKPLITRDRGRTEIRVFGNRTICSAKSGEMRHCDKCVLGSKCLN